jgi:hypothetical protein
MTPFQKKRLDSILTAQKVIDISKGLSNELRQRKYIDSLHKVIKEKNKIIIDLRNDYVTTLKKIAFQNNISKKASNKIDSINDRQLKTERNKKLNWNLLHLYAGVETREFNLQSFEINSELMIELNKFHFGLKAFALPDQNLTYKAGLGVKMRYKFF